MVLKLKKWHILFAINPIVEQNKLSDLRFLKQVHDAIKDAADDAVVTLDVDGARVWQLYQHMSNMQEGLTAPIAAEIMAGDGAAYAGIAADIQAQAQQGNQEAIELATRIQAWRANFYNMRSEYIERNRKFLADNIV